nr:MAG TPA: hypothetical protein [Caudoviricetes sp.]
MYIQASKCIPFRICKSIKMIVSKLVFTALLYGFNLYLDRITCSHSICRKICKCFVVFFFIFPMTVFA